MQILHFSWAFGAFVAPLIAKHFIQEEANDSELSYNMTCSDILINSSLPRDSTTTKAPTGSCLLANLDCFGLFTRACNNLTQISLMETEELNLANFNCTTASDKEPSSQFTYAYLIAASLLLPSLVAFIYYAVRREYFGKCCAKQTLTQEETTSQAKAEEIQNGQPSKYPLCYIIVLFSLIFSFMFLYVGLEAGFGSLIFTVAVKGELCFPKSSAALLQAVYWGNFAFTRLISVTLALLKVRASIMMVGNLFGSFVASLIMTFYIHNSTAIWIGSAVLGMSFASIFPTVMTWMSENATATGKATAVVVTAGSLGDITLPAAMGLLVAKVSPDSLIYVTFVGVIVSAGIAAAMFLTACLQRRRQDRNETLYKRLDRTALEDSTDGCSVNGATGITNDVGNLDSEAKDLTELEDTGIRTTVL